MVETNEKQLTLISPLKASLWSVPTREFDTWTNWSQTRYMHPAGQYGTDWYGLVRHVICCCTVRTGQAKSGTKPSLTGEIVGYTLHTGTCSVCSAVGECSWRVKQCCTVHRVQYSGYREGLAGQTNSGTRPSSTSYGVQCAGVQ